MTTALRLRPMTIGDMFDAAFRLYRQHVVAFIGIAGLLHVPFAILQALIQLTYGDRALGALLRLSTRPPRLLPGQTIFDVLPIGQLALFYAIMICLAVFQVLVIQSLIGGALANATGQALMGQPVSILGAYRLGTRRYLALIGAALTLALASVGLLALIGGCAAGLALLGARSSESSLAISAAVAILVLGALIVLIPAMLFFAVRFLLTPQAIVLEQLGPIEGLARSWRLSLGAFWRMLGIMLLVGILVYLVSGLPSTMVGFALAFDIEHFARNQAITTLVAQLGQIVAQPLVFAIYTLLYYDLRVRREGYDLELRTQQVFA